DTPAQWGATWDVTARVAADERELEALEGDFDIETLLRAKTSFVEQQLAASSAVDAWSVAAPNVVDIEGKAVPPLGIARRGGVDVEVVDGRLPRGANEVALGRKTLDELGLEIGDTARARG